MMSDKPFKENTPNAELGEEPVPVVQPGMPEALDELEAELTDFFHVFRSNPGLRVMNPFFGNLDYEEWVQLLHKHFTHPLRQFGVEAA
jgi:oxepin-CoA hydrolase/3-oxo-5,6-dehydrosuberyl-CoA semialdehyde dehydrogenase